MTERTEQTWTSLRYAREFWLCPVCQMPIMRETVRDEPVGDQGWKRKIKTYHHRDGAQHRVPIGEMFRNL